MSISTELKRIIIISISTVYCLHGFTAVCTLNPLLSPLGGLFERGAYLIQRNASMGARFLEDGLLFVTIRKW